MAAAFTVDSSGHITAVAPPGVEGTVDVRVGNVTGLIAASSAARFTFTMPPAAAPAAAVAPPAERLQSVKPPNPALRRRPARRGAALSYLRRSTSAKPIVPRPPGAVILSRGRGAPARGGAGAAAAASSVRKRSPLAISVHS